MKNVEKSIVEFNIFVINSNRLSEVPVMILRNIIKLHEYPKFLE